MQVKLALRRAQSSKQAITYSVYKGENVDDIEHFLQKNALSYSFDKQQGLLLVEPLHV